MTSYFDPEQGFFVRQPSWHKLEKAVLTDWPGTWEEARKLALLDWEPVTYPVYDEPLPAVMYHPGETDPDSAWKVGLKDLEIRGYQQIKRSDTREVLSIQTSVYRVINNTEFGAVIESVLGLAWDDHLEYEGVFSLHGGKQVVAVLYFKEPLRIPGDTSPTVRYAVFVSRHDGTGGLRCILTNTRVVCANTLGMAETGAREEFTGFSIRHTANWDERVAEVREKILHAKQGYGLYLDAMTKLSMVKVTPSRRERYLAKFLPTGTDMGDRQLQNRENEREQIRTLLQGPTCQGIGTTAYGLLQASTEWVDHYRRANSESSYVTRQLVAVQPLKEKAYGLCMAMTR